MRGEQGWEKIDIKNRAKFQSHSLELMEDSGLLLFMINADTTTAASRACQGSSQCPGFILAVAMVGILQEVSSSFCPSHPDTMMAG